MGVAESKPLTQTTQPTRFAEKCTFSTLLSDDSELGDLFMDSGIFLK